MLYSQLTTKQLRSAVLLREEGLDGDYSNSSKYGKLTRAQTLGRLSGLISDFSVDNQVGSMELDHIIGLKEPPPRPLPEMEF